MSWMRTLSGSKIIPASASTLTDTRHQGVNLFIISTFRSGERSGSSRLSWPVAFPPTASSWLLGGDNCIPSVLNSMTNVGAETGLYALFTPQIKRHPQDQTTFAWMVINDE